MKKHLGKKIAGVAVTRKTLTIACGELEPSESYSSTILKETY